MYILSPFKLFSLIRKKEVWEKEWNYFFGNHFKIARTKWRGHNTKKLLHDSSEKKKILMYPINFRLGKNQGLRHYHAGNTKHAMVAKVKVDSSWHSLLLWSNGLSIFCLRGSRINKCRVGNTLARNSAAYPFVGVHSTDTYE